MFKFPHEMEKQIGEKYITSMPEMPDLFAPVFYYLKSKTWDTFVGMLSLIFNIPAPTLTTNEINYTTNKEKWQGVFVDLDRPFWVCKDIEYWFQNLAIFDPDRPSLYFKVEAKDFWAYIGDDPQIESFKEDRFLFAIKAQAFESLLEEFAKTKQGWYIDNELILPLVFQVTKIHRVKDTKHGSITFTPVKGLQRILPSHFDIALEDLYGRVERGEAVIASKLNTPNEEE